jgi:hypothetical protein
MSSPRKTEKSGTVKNEVSILFLNQMERKGDVILYRRGVDVFLGLNCKDQDFQEGFRLLSLSKHKDAIWLVDVLKKHGIPCNRLEAMRLFLKEGNDARALCFAALVDDWNTELLLQSARIGFAVAQAYVADYNFRDDGAEAFKWAVRSACQHEPLGLCILGHCYRLGEGVTQVDLLAFYRYKEAAESENVEAQYWLACQYLAQEDMVNFFFWLGMSISNGNGGEAKFFNCARSFVAKFDPSKIDVPTNSVIFQIGQSLHGHIEVLRRTIWKAGVSDNILECAKQAVGMYEFWVARARDASFWWICIGRRLGVAAEIRRLVGKLIWDDRVNGRYLLERN